MVKRTQAHSMRAGMAPRHKVLPGCERPMQRGQGAQPSYYGVTAGLTAGLPEGLMAAQSQRASWSWSEL